MNTYKIEADDDVLTFKGQKYAVKKMGTKEYGQNRFASAVKEGAKINANGAYPVSVLEIRLNLDESREILHDCGSAGYNLESRKLEGHFVWYPDRGVKFEPVAG